MGNHHKHNEAGTIMKSSWRYQLNPLMSPLRVIGYEIKLAGVVIKEKLFVVCLN